MIKTYDSFSEAYLGILNDIFNNYDMEETVIKSEKYNHASLIEKLGYKFVIKEPKELDIYPITKSEERNKVIRDYIDKEVILFDDGNDNSDGKMSELSKIWKIISNPDGTINSNYGLMIYHTKDAGNLKHQPDQGYINQWDWAKQRLMHNMTTLQAILHFNRTTHQWTNNKDQPCTVFIQFLIRNNKLHLYGYMRSNDAVYGTPYNISYFIRLMHRMKNELKTRYPNLEIGNYTHNATSLHIYKRNFDKVKIMLGL